MESFLAAMNKREESALEQAQSIMYDAWGETGSRKRISLARKALAISPLCADAYNLLAQEAATLEEARDLYARGLEAGTQALGPEGFEEFADHFWGFLETRPYMRARHGLALTLLRLGEEDAAVEHLRGMLALNPNDNQGIRYLLLGVLLGRDDIAEVEALLKAYEDDGSPFWLYTGLLLAYRAGRTDTAGTRRLLKDAQKGNPHVPGMLAGRIKVPPRGAFITSGGADEAAEYAEACGSAWANTPGAIAWLAAATGEAAPEATKGAAPAATKRATKGAAPAAAKGAAPAAVKEAAVKEAAAKGAAARGQRSRRSSSGGPQTS
jgi:tetratricopeptide (TPR) repeat protein